MTIDKEENSEELYTKARYDDMHIKKTENAKSIVVIIYFLKQLKFHILNAHTAIEINEDIFMLSLIP